MISESRFVTENNLTQGIIVFKNRNWPKDFHYSLYQELDSKLQEGVPQMAHVNLPCVRKHLFLIAMSVERIPMSKTPVLLFE